MKTVTKTALANVKQNKGRNFLCGCAIALTTFLIFVVLTVGYGMIRVRLASVDAYYPTYHIMFRQVRIFCRLIGYENIKFMVLFL